MRFNTGALFVICVMLGLGSSLFAQAPNGCPGCPRPPRPQPDKIRNTSPTVGTGGPEGGATGLFTIYDGSTIRKGEFTFSIAYSNYDRDPGNVDIVDIPASFNVGLNDHIELFFKSNLMRGIKVNNPQNLSSFYLPNVSLCQAIPPCSGPAIILAPSGPNVGTLAGSSVFRPLNNQPFVQFPFIGGSAGTFGLTPGLIGQQFGFPGFQALIGSPIGSGGRFSGASSFPGMGSPAGSILPGIVLATVQIPCTALTGGCQPPGNPGSQDPIYIPTTFTIAPSYLPDAPFISRQYGQSSFTNYVIGAKIRFTGPHNPLGVGIIPFYRWYPDNADDFRGFNQMQRGAGPGGNIFKGDLGLVGFIDARVHTHANVSVNVGYILNSNEKAKALADSVLLDRPNEFLVGVGMDFPVNKHFQPMVETRMTHYDGARTQNAFENNPVELLGGVKIYPKRWWGFGVAYRRHLNEQDESHINPQDFNVSVANLSGVNVVGRGIVIVPGFTVPATTNGFPNGFRFSHDPNGFIVQFFVGHRNPQGLPSEPNRAPSVSVTASSSSITLPCKDGNVSDSGANIAKTVVQLSAMAIDPDNDVLTYEWTVTGGKKPADGNKVNWDLSDAAPGKYEATVKVNDGNGCVTECSIQVQIESSQHCCKIEPPSCEVKVEVTTERVKAGTIVTAEATPQAKPADASIVDWVWEVDHGTITDGQHNPTIKVDTTGLPDKTVVTVKAKLTVRNCAGEYSCSGESQFTIWYDSVCKLFDDYGAIKFNDEKARLDNFAIELHSNQGSTGMIVAYTGDTDTCEDIGSKKKPLVGRVEAEERWARARDYLKTRGIDEARLAKDLTGTRNVSSVELFVCPAGVAPPGPTQETSRPDPICHPNPPVKHRGKKRVHRQGS